MLDHHQVSDPRPPAVALVNPQLTPAGRAHQRELCSVGLPSAAACGGAPRPGSLEDFTRTLI